MSGKIMGQVWDIVLPPPQQLVLLALTDHADHTGGSIRPSFGLIAWKTGYSERQVRRIVKQLEQAKLLVRVETRPGKPTVYRADLSAGRPKPAYANDKSEQPTPDIMTPDKMSYDKMTPDMPREEQTTDPGHHFPQNGDEPSVVQPSFKRVAVGRVNTPAPAARIAQIEKHPVWQAYVRGWDGIVVKVDPRLAEVTFNAVQQLQADIDNGSATLADIEGTTRWKLSQTRKLRYLITYVGPDIQDFQAFRRASSGKPARASPPPVVPAAQSLTPEDIARRMAEKERILATAGAR